MNLLNTKSLALTVENINNAFFNDIAIAKPEKLCIAKWIASRQGGPRSYANMFEPTPLDFNNGFKLFTGEDVKSRASISYSLGQDCCRLLAKLEINDKVVQTSLRNAVNGITQRINSYNYTKGFYCCGKCSGTYLRYLAIDADKNAALLNSGMKILKSYRIGNGKWHRFPFWYTVLALSEIPAEFSANELKYSRPVWEKILNSKPRNDKFSLRRFQIAQNALQFC